MNSRTGYRASVELDSRSIEIVEATVLLKLTNSFSVQV